MKILTLSEENCKRISTAAFDLSDKGNLIIIAGDNEQGKSSVLDGIEMALNGAESIPPKPVRRGQDKSTIEVTLGEIGLPELTVRRVITASGGGSLVVKNADGVKQDSPQTILDKLKGKLTFDPLAFANMKPVELSSTIRALLGLDFSKEDAERKRIFDQRTGVNSEVKSIEARIQVLPPIVPGLPELEISSAEITAQMTAAAETNQSNANHRRNADGYKQAWERACARVSDIAAGIKVAEDEIAGLQAALERRKAALETAKSEITTDKVSYDNASDAVSKLVDVDLKQYEARASDVDRTNANIRNNKSRADLRVQLTEKSKAADALTKKIEAIERQKRDAVAAAKFPVPGMSLDDTGNVLLDGLPFEQASTRGKIIASLAMGAALNPKLHVVLVRSGNDIDDAGLKIVGDWCEANKFQVWLERIRKDGNVTFLIEDGHIAGVEQPVSIPPTSDEEPKMDMPAENETKSASSETKPPVSATIPAAPATAPAKRGPKRPPASAPAQDPPAGDVATPLEQSDLIP